MTGEMQDPQEKRKRNNVYMQGEGVIYTNLRETLGVIILGVLNFILFFNLQRVQASNRELEARLFKLQLEAARRGVELKLEE